MVKVLLGFIDNKRPELLDQTIKSLEQNLIGDFIYRVIINDSGDLSYHDYLMSKYMDKYNIISHETNKGLSGSIRTLWDIAKNIDADYVWHQEGDFTFNEKINLNTLLRIFNPYIAQVALKRQPVNQEEANFGGFMQCKRASYVEEYKDEIKYCSHRNFFTLNPSIYPRWIVDLGWEQGWGEKEFSSLLFNNEMIKCAYYGWIDDPPVVNHIGAYRGNNWFV